MNTVKKLLLLIFIAGYQTANALPENFVYLKNIAPSIKQDIRYNSSHNFVGKHINGYQKSTCILTHDAAEMLTNVQKQLNKKGLGLLVYDCYRPQRAVENFVVWSKNPNDQKNKREYYPRIDKPDLFRKGYVASYSGHTRGSTVDLTIINLQTGKPLDMGTHFDFLDPLSNPKNPLITASAKQNRMLLRRVMINNGFVPLSTEWWHFSLADEPYPDTYFDFVVR